jgi:hypothetical protein
MVFLALYYVREDNALFDLFIISLSSGYVFTTRLILKLTCLFLSSVSWNCYSSSLAVIGTVVGRDLDLPLGVLYLSSDSSSSDTSIYLPLLCALRLVRDLSLYIGTVGGGFPMNVLIFEIPLNNNPLTLCTIAVVLSYAISAYDGC